MTEPNIPTYIEMMHPTLQGLERLGGSGSGDSINKEVVELMGLTEGQLAQEFPEGSSASGSKVLHRLAFARTYLKKLGAVDNHGLGSWQITEKGEDYLKAADGADRLRFDEHEYRRGFPDVSEFLTEAKERAGTADPWQLTVRDLLERWGVKRRGSMVLERIERDLTQAGLHTEPSFESAWIDETVSILSIATPSETPVEIALPDAYATTLTIGTLESANRGVETVTPEAHLIRAQSLMMRYDYSQLAVASSPWSLKGAISWESIAKARLRNPEAGLPEAVVDAETVRIGDPLLEHIPRIVKSGYVFVLGADDGLSGIVTTADLSEQFARLANPFLILGEIERSLRAIVDAHFSVEDLIEYQDPNDADRQVTAAESLTLGEHLRLLQTPTGWERIGWKVDRTVFVDALDEVRRIRNEVMHFSPDPLDESDLRQLDDFRRWLRELLPR